MADKASNTNSARGQQPPRDSAQDEALIEDLIKEVRHMARVASKGVPEHVRADVESAAMVGLMEALRHLEKMDPEHFRRYLQVRVRGALLDEARHFDPLSRAERKLVRQVDKATQDHRKLHGRAPDMHEVAQSIQRSEDECWSALELSEFAILPITDETISSDVFSPEEAFVDSYAAAALRWGLGQLDERERLVLRLAYKRNLPLSTIAKRLGVSAPRAHQIRLEAERNLARLMRNSPALSQLSGTYAKFDWDECTEDTLKDGTPRYRSAQ